MTRQENWHELLNDPKRADAYMREHHGHAHRPLLPIVGRIDPVEPEPRPLPAPTMTRQQRRQLARKGEA